MGSDPGPDCTHPLGRWAEFNTACSLSHVEFYPPLQAAVRFGNVGASRRLRADQKNWFLCWGGKIVCVTISAPAANRGTMAMLKIELAQVVVPPVADNQAFGGRRH
jgi:hypothetical protein